MDWRSFIFLMLFSLCSSSYSEERYFTDNTFVLVNYTIWFPGENDALEDRNIMVEILNNSTFYDVVRLASYINEDFAFEFEVIGPDSEHIITSIHGIEQQRDKYILWIIYQLNSPPDMNAIPSDDLITIGGVDDLRVSAGDNFLFWLKDLSPENVQKPNS